MKCLACWKAKWISMAGRLTLVTDVLSALPAYQLIALFHPKWLIKQLDKLRRSFLWAASESAPGGRCLVNWTSVCMPKDIGGLGVPNLALQSQALRLRWLWQQATDASKPWQGLPLPVDNITLNIFRVSTTITIHGGNSSFWHSNWHSSCTFAVQFPNLFKHSRQRQITVRNALSQNGWIAQIKANPPRQVLVEYIQLWCMVENLLFEFDNQPDKIIWRWTSDGVYTPASAYNFLFQCRSPNNHLADIWKIKATPKCKLHAWILLRNRALTADNLAKRGWPHDDKCKLCNSETETALHLFVACSFSQAVWTQVIARSALPVIFTLPTQDSSLKCWWLSSLQNLPNQIKLRWQSLALLTWWFLWKERNNRIFNNKARVSADLVDKIILELNDWRSAGILKTSWPQRE